MKTQFKSLVLLGLIFSSILSCSKSKNASSGHVSNTGKLTLSNSSVNRGQQLSAEVTGLTSPSKVSWTVQPAGRNTLTSAGLSSLLQFVSAGAYTITATYLDSSSGTPYDSSSSPVLVNDSIQALAPPPTSDTITFSGSQIHLRPIWADSSFGLIVSTDSIYQGLPFFATWNGGPYQGIDTPGTVFLGFNSAYVAFYDLPSGPSLNAATFVIIYPPNYLSNGLHALTVDLHNTAYEGTINITDLTVSITWNYSSGVIVSPLVVQKK